ncbi:hypothetical protein Hdeb2414_s0004g00136471 [Helianthus debilis subsp. tardiflorus]
MFSLRPSGNSMSDVSAYIILVKLIKIKYTGSRLAMYLRRSRFWIFTLLC